MITRIEQFTKDEIDQMRSEAKLWRDGVQSEHPVIELAAGITLLGLLGALIKQAGTFAFSVIDFYVSACSIMGQRLISNTYDFYNDVSKAMADHGYDEVKLEVTYETYNVPPRNTFGGGNYEVQSKVPTVYAFHNRYGWIMM